MECVAIHSEVELLIFSHLVTQEVYLTYQWASLEGHIKRYL